MYVYPYDLWIHEQTSRLVSSGQKLFGVRLSIFNAGGEKVTQVNMPNEVLAV